MSHPYKQFENSALWEVINNGINELSNNNNIEEATRREYIVGYLCELISELEMEKK